MILPDIQKNRLSEIGHEGEAIMSSQPEHRITKDKPARRLLVTMAVSAPIIFLVIWLLG